MEDTQKIRQWLREAEAEIVKLKAEIAQLKGNPRLSIKKRQSSSYSVVKT